MDLDREQYINSVNLNIDTDFPYLVLDVINDNSFPRNPGFHVMHWHEDLQFILVLEGTIEVQTLDTSVLIHTGEGLFINKNVVHDVRRLENCHYNSFLFPAYFLEFYAGSPAKDFVDSVTSNDRMAFIHFTTALDWHKEVIVQLKKLVQIEKNKTDFYVYEILVRLSLLWLVMRKLVTLPQEQRESIVRLRMQKILRFIEEHYAEDITLTDLSMSANVSLTEITWFLSGLFKLLILILIENNQHFDFRSSDYIDHIHFVLVSFAKFKILTPGIKNLIFKL